MNLHASSERLADSIQRSTQHWEQQRTRSGGQIETATRAPARWTIALSREAGARGSSIGHRAGELLGWPVYDRELLQKIAEEKGLRLRLLESVDEKHASWLQNCLEGLVVGPHVSEGAYVRYLAESLLSLSALGECIIVGRGAPVLLPPETTLRVRLIAPEKDRIAYLSRRFGISEAEAAQWVRKTDHERDTFVRTHFHKDPADLRLFDLVINTSRFSTDAAAHLIAQAVRERAGS